MTLEQMSANLSKWLDNHPDCSEGTIPLHPHPDSCRTNFTFVFTALKTEQGQGVMVERKNSQILGQSHSLCKEMISNEGISADSFKMQKYQDDIFL